MKSQRGVYSKTLKFFEDIFFAALVRSDTSRSGKFPPKIPIFQFFLPSDHNKSFCVGLKNTQFKAGSAHSFTLGQKYAWVGPSMSTKCD